MSKRSRSEAGTRNATTSSKSQGNELVSSLEKTIKVLMNTHDLVENFYEAKCSKGEHDSDCTCEAQEKLFDNLSDLVQCYRRVDHNRNKVGEGGEVKVPLELLDHLDRKDKKNNPDLFGKLKAETSLEERERLNRYSKNFDMIANHVNDKLDDA